jgi:uncharacterized protein YbjT (DUF2867 family)
VLLTGATGYVGGRLLPLLEASGYRVRCLARNPRHLRDRTGADTEVVEGDVLEYGTLPPAMEGIDVAYYLIHSMGSSGDFEEQDRVAAENFARAAREAGVNRIVYLGGLGHEDDLSRHLRSRQEVGRIFRNSGVPTLEFRASIIIGSGSLSFEMIRSLVERLPVMITPRWVRTPAQPIGVEDVLAYLHQAVEIDLEGSHVLEIGGDDVASYGEIMQEYARQRGLRRWMIPVPVLTPHLSSLWLGLVTPLYSRVGKKLVTSLVHETVVQDDTARRVFDVEPLGLEAAIRRAREREDARIADTRWSDALSSGGEPWRWGGVRFGSRIVDTRRRTVRCSPGDAFRPIRRVGGDVGWYYADWLWHLRGFLDRLAGGVGVRRGRRHPTELSPGDAVDFWRVEEVDPPRLLRLRAEMKVPGRAWLQFEVEDVPGGDDRARICQTAIFDPVGLAGLGYWYALYPLHSLVFRGMLSGIARSAEEHARDREPVRA